MFQCVPALVMLGLSPWLRWCPQIYQMNLGDTIEYLGLKPPFTHRLQQPLMILAWEFLNGNFLIPSLLLHSLAGIHL